MDRYDVTVIGGGPGGLAAALASVSSGAKTLLIEREDKLGGILKQCIHDGFGVIRFGEKLSGCEYACRYVNMIRDSDVEVMISTFASKIEKEDAGYKLRLSHETGFDTVWSKSLVLATGCRERTARQVSIHGTRPTGVLTAGSAQNYINIMGELPGKKCVILGSGDIGLIMARRLTLEGAEVLGVYEAKSEPSGLSRNIFQCLTDFDIPLHLSHTVTEVHGINRVCGVTICQVDDKMRPITGTEEYVECDTLILSVGLIPENELAESLNVKISKFTKGPICDDSFMTSVEGIFTCGNALHVNDLVDYVSESGELAGMNAAKYSKGESFLKTHGKLKVSPSEDFLYIVPQIVNLNGNEKVAMYFRSKETRQNTKVIVKFGERTVFEQIYSELKPPEMEKIVIDMSEPGIEGVDELKFMMKGM